MEANLEAKIEASKMPLQGSSGWDASRRVWEDPFEEAQAAADDTWQRADEWLAEARRGDLPLNDYLANLSDELRHLDSMIDSWRSDFEAGHYPREAFEEAKLHLKEAKQEIHERRRDAPRLKAAGVSEGFPARGRWARFDYVDNDGVITHRELTNWELRGRYIVGFDRTKKSERTFRQDRIQNWQC